MNNCLWCDEALIIQINWKNIFHLSRIKNVCERCWEQFETLQGVRCAKCSRLTSEQLCNDCKKWDDLYEGQDPLTKNFSLFTYNSFMREVITRWKYQGDYLVGEIFHESFFSKFFTEYKHLHKHALIVPIPLSKKRSYERGFNQAELLATFLTSNISLLLKRQHDEKQSKKTRMDRLTTKNPFSLQETINKPVLLVDDI